MSSPIHQTSDLDGALRYAPPRVRAKLQQASGDCGPAAEEPPSNDDGCDDGSFAGGCAAPPLHRRHSLDPEIVPEPPPDLEDDDLSGSGLLLRFCSVAAVAAVIAGAFVVLPGVRSLKHENLQSGSALIAIASGPRSQNLWRAVSTMRVEQRNEDDGGGMERMPQPRGRLLPRSQAAATAAEPGETEQAPLVTEQPPSGRLGAPALIIRHIDHDEVRSLVQRGEEFIASGDLAAARLVLQRAAEAGDVRAALALAGTFDPNMLAKGGSRQLADAAQARLWYERARQFGSVEAPQRLEQLAAYFNAVH